MRDEIRPPAASSNDRRSHASAFAAPLCFFAALFFFAAFTSGCGHSAATHLFTLIADSGKPSGRYQGPPVQIESVIVPPGLDGSRIVRRTSKTEVEARDTEHWSAPLGQLMRQTLTEDLAGRLPAGAVIYPDAPRPDPTIGIVIDVLRCEDTGDGLAVDASWSISKPDRSGMAARGEKHIKRGGAGNADAMAVELSAALGELADGIVTDLLGRQ